MQSRSVLTLAVLISLSLFPAVAAPAASNAAGEYAKHLAALSGLSVDVPKAMPADQYGLRPHPESMDFGQLLSHIATANYQFCAGLKDSVPADRKRRRGQIPQRLFRVLFRRDHESHRGPTRCRAQLPGRSSSRQRSPPRPVCPTDKEATRA